MTTKSGKKFRDAAILAAATVFCSFLAAYFIFAAYGGVGTGVLQARRDVVLMAEDPTAFWMGITWRVICGITFAFVAVRVAIIGFRIYKKGTLFVANDGRAFRNPGSTSPIAPLMDEANTTTIDR